MKALTTQRGEKNNCVSLKRNKNNSSTNPLLPRERLKYEHLLQLPSARNGDKKGNIQAKKHMRLKCGKMHLNDKNKGVFFSPITAFLRLFEEDRQALRMSAEGQSEGEVKKQRDCFFGHIHDPGVGRQTQIPF